MGVQSIYFHNLINTSERQREWGGGGAALKLSSVEGRGPQPGRSGRKVPPGAHAGGEAAREVGLWGEALRKAPDSKRLSLALQRFMNLVI